MDVEEARLVADQKINRRLEAMEPMTAGEREVYDYNIMLISVYLLALCVES